MTRAALRSRQAEWATRLGALRGRQADVAARFGALPSISRAKVSRESLVRRQRAEVAIVSTRQTIAGGDLQIASRVNEVVAAIEREDGTGEDALNSANTGISEYLATQEQNLATAEAALIHVTD